MTCRLFEQLGSGQFGNVMKGMWLLSGGSKDVAVKILKEGSSEDDKVKFIQARVYKKGERVSYSVLPCANTL